jgi:hypothetical protein
MSGAQPKLRACLTLPEMPGVECGSADGRGPGMIRDPALSAGGHGRNGDP